MANYKPLTEEHKRKIGEANRGPRLTAEQKLESNKRLTWQRHRAQAKFRNEAHTLAYDEWLTIWGEHLLKRTHRLSRIDPALPWAIDNVILKEAYPKAK